MIITVHRTIETLSGDVVTDKTQWTWDLNLADGIRCRLADFLDDEVKQFFKDIGQVSSFDQVDSFAITSNDNGWVQSGDFMVDSGEYTINVSHGLTPDQLTKYEKDGGLVMDNPAGMGGKATFVSQYIIPEWSPYYTGFFMIGMDKMKSQTLKVYYG